MPITQPWTMKLDPDERLTDGLKDSIAAAISGEDAQGFSFDRRLWFMGQPMPVHQPVLRVWRTGRCRFSDSLVNERPMIDGTVQHIEGELEHHDSPNLHHWFEKQNRYMTAEAEIRFRGDALAARPRLFGTALERWMWMKQVFYRLPLRYPLLFLYHALWLGAWKAGRVGWIWARLRTELYRSMEYKLLEMQMAGRSFEKVPTGHGAPHPRARQIED